jgi:predicted acylesterase/phospholipase RssA
MSNSINPLHKIALAFSGGGFRAASFCLGCLSYLNYRTIKNDNNQSETLLSRVEFISSASGGSFSNLVYAYHLYTKKPFEECYNHLKQFMKGDQLVNDVLEILNNDKAWKNYPHKGRNLINAFAIAYDEALFDGATLGLLNNPTQIEHLREVCVNATEFEDGLSFRFQNNDNKTRTGLVGNRNLYLNTKDKSLETISKIKLADILAASSCFPGGFEAMVFPDDFAHSDLSIKDLSSTIYHKSVSQNTEEQEAKPSPKLKFALMDGGIDDNQGIQSMMLANNRAGRVPFDAFIVCDVASPYMEPYIPRPEDKKWFLGKYSLRFWGWVYVIISALLIVLGLTVVKDKWGIVAQTVMVTLGTILLLVAVLVRFTIKNKYNSFIKKNSWGNILDKYIKYIFKIRVSVLKQMVEARAESMVKMTTDIFLKQIRRLSYRLFYENNALTNRRVSATIYELSTDGYPETLSRLKRESPGIAGKIPQPSKELMDVAQTAREMGTTLWFDDDSNKMRDKIIATGRFTMCYNLFVYLLEIENKNISLNPNLQELKANLLADWEEFNKNPMYIHT